MSVQISPSLSPFAMYYKSESRLLTDTKRVSETLINLTDATLGWWWWWWGGGGGRKGVFLVVAEQVTSRNIVGEQVCFVGLFIW